MAPAIFAAHCSLAAAMSLKTTLNFAPISSAQEAVLIINPPIAMSGAVIRSMPHLPNFSALFSTLLKLFDSLFTLLSRSLSRRTAFAVLVSMVTLKRLMRDIYFTFFRASAIAISKAALASSTSPQLI